MGTPELWTMTVFWSALDLLRTAHGFVPCLMRAAFADTPRIRKRISHSVCFSLFGQDAIASKWTGSSADRPGCETSGTVRTTAIEQSVERSIEYTSHGSRGITRKRRSGDLRGTKRHSE